MEKVRMKCIERKYEPDYGIIAFRFRPVFDEDKDEDNPLSLQVIVSGALVGIEPFIEGSDYYLSIDPVNDGLKGDLYHQTPTFK